MPPSFATAPLFLVLALCASTHPGRAQAPAMPAADPATCDALVNMPSAPMTVEACKSMLQLMQDDPAAHRPGDEAMGCAEIFAELDAATAHVRVSDAEAARRHKVLADTQSLNERHGTKAAAATAPNAAALQALAVAGTVTPSAVIAPAVAAQQADLQAKGRIASDAYVAEARQLTGANAAVAASMMSDPRTRRLAQLAAARDCHGPNE